MTEAALNEQNLGPIIVGTGTSEEDGERNLEYFNYRDCERSTNKKESFKHLWKARVMLLMAVTGLHNSYPRRVIPTDRRVWPDRIYLFRDPPLLKETIGDISLSSGCCWIECLNLRLSTVERYCVTRARPAQSFLAFILEGKLSVLKCCHSQSFCRTLGR